MKRLMNFLFLSCIKASELIEKKLDYKLNAKEKIQLFLHTKMCDVCNSYQKQSEQLDLTLRKHITSYQEDKKDPKPELTEDFKKSMVEKLKDH